MTAENAASSARAAGRIDSLERGLLAKYAGQLERLRLTGTAPAPPWRRQGMPIR